MVRIFSHLVFGTSCFLLGSDGRSKRLNVQWRPFAVIYIKHFVYYSIAFVELFWDKEPILILFTIWSLIYSTSPYILSKLLPCFCCTYQLRVSWITFCIRKNISLTSFPLHFHVKSDIHEFTLGSTVLSPWIKIASWNLWLRTCGHDQEVNLAIIYLKFIFKHPSRKSRIQFSIARIILAIWFKRQI